VARHPFREIPAKFLSATPCVKAQRNGPFFAEGTIRS
jgi:hypothetical protein